MGTAPDVSPSQFHMTSSVHLDLLGMGTESLPSQNLELQTTGWSETMFRELPIGEERRLSGKLLGSMTMR